VVTCLEGFELAIPGLVLMSETSTEDFAESHPWLPSLAIRWGPACKAGREAGIPMRMSDANALGAINAREVFVNNPVNPHGRDSLPRLGPNPRALP
jgi:hypothetical protein